MMRRALAEAVFVARRRVAFGKRLVEMPLMRRQLAKLMLPAEQARTIGLVHDVLPREAFADAALDFCRSLAALPREAFAAGKLAIELAADLDRAQARNVERMTVSALVQGDEYKTTMAAMQARLRARAARPVD